MIGLQRLSKWVGKLLLLAVLGLAPPVTLAVAESPVDRAIERARAGELSREELSRVVLAQAETDQRSIANPERLVLLFPGFVDELGPELVAKVEAAVRVGNSVVAEQLKEFAARLLGQSSKYYAEVDRWCSLNFRVKDLLSRGTVAELKAFHAALRSDSEKALFVPQLEQYVQQTVVTRVRQDPPAIALKTLADYAPLDSSDAVPKAAAETLGKLTLAKQQGTLNFNGWNLDDPAVLSLLARTLKLTPQAENQIAQLYGARAGFLAANEKWNEVDTLVNTISTTFPEHKAIQIQIKREAVHGVRSSSTIATSFAKRQVADLVGAGALSTGDKLSFLVKGYYANTLIKVLLAVILVLMLTFIGLIVAGRFFPSVASLLGSGGDKLERMRVERLRKQAKKRGVGYIAPIDADDEYSKLLKKFGLSDRATEADIKKAYRQLMKEHHPDAQGAGGVKTDEDGKVDRSFEEYKKAYNRLLAMRGSTFRNSR